jgi:hypothetical protein
VRAWLVDPATGMAPAMNFGAAMPGGSHAAAGRPEGVIEALPLVEVAQAIPFLAAGESQTAPLSEADMSAVHGWFSAYLGWLTAPQDSGPRLAVQARDRKDHHGSSWLLQATACALLTATGGGPRSEDHPVLPLRQRFKMTTLRAQISPDGTFPHELTSDNPYRNSLFNLDMLAVICELLSTRFENLWEYELSDGPSMRAAMAYHFPYIQGRGRWPYLADASHFADLPGRRPGLLLAARAYNRPEYAALWKMLPPDPGDAEILRTIPIHQPLLWVRQTAHAAG